MFRYIRCGLQLNYSDIWNGLLIIYKAALFVKETYCKHLQYPYIEKYQMDIPNSTKQTQVSLDLYTN